MPARDTILQKLRDSLQGTTPLNDTFSSAVVTTPWQYPTRQKKIKQLRTMMEAVRTEIHETTQREWLTLLADIVRKKNIGQLLCAPHTLHGMQLTDFWQAYPQLPPLVYYDRPIEAWKETLFFETDASITGTQGAIAATGSLIIRPTPDEPRTMSLVPPIHFALLKASDIVDNLYEAMQRWQWVNHMPANLLLVSGPSKTADIEQILAYGAHGPKELITFIITDA